MKITSGVTCIPHPETPPCLLPIISRVIPIFPTPEHPCSTSTQTDTISSMWSACTFQYCPLKSPTSLPPPWYSASLFFLSVSLALFCTLRVISTYHHSILPFSFFFWLTSYSANNPVHLSTELIPVHFTMADIFIMYVLPQLSHHSSGWASKLPPLWLL